MGVSSAVNLTDVLNQAPKNIVIVDSLVKAHGVLSKHEKVLCSVSGGSDSDVILDICCRLDPDKQIKYVWFDTGVEFQATKDHLKYLEEHYGIEIKREKPVKSIPRSCKEYGQPFISKQVSEFVYRLQLHGFDFSKGNRGYEELMSEYPNCQSALEWWCDEKGNGSCFGIARNRYLREFMIENPPWFKISNRCCTYAKKGVAHRVLQSDDFGLNITGVRRSEGGVRATAYKTCYTTGEVSTYRPIFWYSDNDKKEYCDHYGVSHSGCYTDYGMIRTGCVGCPYSRDIDFELNVLKEHEPALYKVACHVFKDAYEYTEMYHSFVRKQKSGGQMEIWDFIERSNT